MSELEKISWQMGINDACLIIQREMQQQESLARAAAECQNAQEVQECRLCSALLLMINNRIQALATSQGL